MAEPEAPPPHAGERLTREDVLRLIEEHSQDVLRLLEQGRPADLELDLRRAKLWRADLQGVDLPGADLQGADLEGADLQGANLPDANLQGANLREANLQGAYLGAANLKGADLREAQLQGTRLDGASLREGYLRWADLQGADLREANLQQADLRKADLRRARLAHASVRGANLEDASWGDYILGDESAGNFPGAASLYRALKQWHADAGMYDIAGEFHYREMEARRKLAWKLRHTGAIVSDFLEEVHYVEVAPRRELAWKEGRPQYALSMYLLRFLYGYGERPVRVIGWAAAIILGLALVHWAFGTVAGGFLEALYYSAVSFTALGYGWAAEPQGWAGKFLGVGEALMGVFMMALFLVTFTRKMTR
jgi:hypothetical protein